MPALAIAIVVALAVAAYASAGRITRWIEARRERRRVQRILARQRWNEANRLRSG